MISTDAPSFSGMISTDAHSFPVGASLLAMLWLLVTPEKHKEHREQARSYARATRQGMPCPQIVNRRQ
jgi:hypothetical protein